MALSVRQHGLVKIIGGGLAYTLVWYGVFQQGDFGESRGGTFYIIAMGAPGALALVGLVEAATGTSFTKLEEWWNNLKGWQRFLYGMSIVIAFAVLLFGSLLLYGYATFK